jgi:hypothetical protein
MRNSYNILARKSEGKRLHGRPKHRWEDNIGMNLREIGGMIWTGFIWLWIRTNGRLL